MFKTIDGSAPGSGFRGPRIRRHDAVASIATWVLVTVVVASQAGCSHSTPSVADARQALEREISEQSEGRIKLASFKKTDGKLEESYYDMDFEAEIEFVEDCTWITGSLAAGTFRTAPAAAGSPAHLKYVPQSILGGTPVKKGERKPIHGTLAFEKTERGWRRIG